METEKPKKFEVTLVDGSQLVHGDYVQRGISGEVNGQVKGHWGVTVEARDGKLGVVEDGGWRYEDRFCWGNKFEVRLPRPEPVANEFGLVSP